MKVIKAIIIIRQIHHFKRTFHILGALPLYKHIHFKTTFMCPQTHNNNNTNNYETYIHYQHTNTSLHNNIPYPIYTTKRQHTLKTQKTTHAQNTKQDKTKQKNNNDTTNNYNPYNHYQHTHTSLQNNIPQPEYTPNVQMHPLQNNIHVSKDHCGRAFEPGASGLLYYCTPPVCVPAVIGTLAVW